MKWLVIVLVAALAGTCAQAQPVRTEHNISLELASQLANDAMAACAGSGFNVSVAVVDRGGAVRASQRGDMAGPHTLAAAQQKAYTAASANATTQALGERAQAPNGAAYLVHIPGFLLLGGGVPVKVGNELIGALGVAGAPRGIQDEQCAMTAIEKSRDKLKLAEPHA